MALDPFFQQGMNAWGDRVKAQEGRAAALNAATSSNEIKNILAQKKAGAASALEALKHRNLIGQHGLQHRGILAERDKPEFGDLEQRDLATGRFGDILKTYGEGFGELNRYSGYGITPGALPKLLSGGRPDLSTFEKRIPLSLQNAIAGKQVIGDELSGQRLVKPPGGGPATIQSYKKSKKQTSKQPLTTKPVNQIDFAQRLAKQYKSDVATKTVNGKSVPIIVKGKNMSKAGPVVGPINGRWYGIDSNGQHVDVTDEIK